MSDSAKIDQILTELTSIRELLTDLPRPITVYEAISAEDTAREVSRVARLCDPADSPRAELDACTRTAMCPSAMHLSDCPVR